MASILSNARRTAFGAAAVVLLVVEFAAQGGPADKTTAAVDAALHKDEAGNGSSSASPQSASAAPRPAPTSWFAPTPDEESMPSPDVAPTPNWGASEQPHNPDAIHRPPPRGVDFPENG